MSWNYRIVKSESEEGEDTFAIHEVYYDRDGKTVSWEPDPTLEGYESLEEIWSDLEMMTNDAISNRPILKLAELEQLLSKRGEHVG